MKATLRRLWHDQQFDPNWIGIFINPFFLARRELNRAMRELAPSASGRLLDVGCGTKPYRALFNVQEYVGLDIDTSLARGRGVADVYYDGRRFPFDDNSFDAVLCNQVLEHVFNPEEFMRELQRVLTPGGRLILTVPFVWDEHEQPHDFARYSSFGLRALLERNGFRVLKQRKLLGDCSLLFQLANAYLYKVSNSRHRAVNLLTTAVLMAPLSALGTVLGRLLPQNQDLFLDQAVLAEKMT